MYTFVITGRNTAPWVDRCLGSVLHQFSDAPFRTLWLDDASTDESRTKARRYAGAAGLELRCFEPRRGAMHHLVPTIRALAPEDVVLFVGGDDWLAHEYVLERVRAEYDAGAWLTYGQYKIHAPHNPYGEWCPLEGGGRLYEPAHDAYGHCAPVGGPPRSAPFTSSHLLTFRAGLFQKIADEDLRDAEGGYLTMAADLAFMLPMLEMAGSRARFIPEILYVYNRETPDSDDKVDREKQKALSRLIRSRRVYDRLETL